MPALSSLSTLNVSNVNLNLADNKIKNLENMKWGIKERNESQITSLILTNNELSTLALEDLPNSINNKL